MNKSLIKQTECNPSKIEKHLTSRDAFFIWGTNKQKRCHILYSQSLFKVSILTSLKSVRHGIDDKGFGTRKYLEWIYEDLVRKFYAILKVSEDGVFEISIQVRRLVIDEEKFDEVIATKLVRDSVFFKNVWPKDCRV